MVSDRSRQCLAADGTPGVEGDATDEGRRGRRERALGPPLVSPQAASAEDEGDEEQPGKDDHHQLGEEGDAAYPSDRDFHRTLLRLADSPALTEAADSVTARISLARSRSAGQPARARAALGEHRDIVSALVAGDGDEAARLVRVHLLASLDNAISLLEPKG